jgi:non-heme chloroperoxidase
MKKAVLIALGTLVGIALLPIAIVAYLLIFGTEKPPQPLSSVTNPFATMDYRGLPPIERYQARDGTALSYRTYPAGESHVAVLIHGSAGSSSDMHALAQALQRAGITVYVPDLRGHGANLPHGDLAYMGQLDDDLADFLRDAEPRHPGAKWTLVGFSSGGGFALRIAGGPLGPSFDRYALLSPFLRYDAPTMRPAETSKDGKALAEEKVWATAYVKRIIGLLILNAIGVHWFDGLNVIAFAVPRNVSSVTAAYSWRMLQSFQPHDDFMADIRSVSRPMIVFVGGADQLFLPEEFKPVFGSNRNGIPVKILPGLGHSDMVTSSVAIQAVVSALEQWSQADALPARPAN